MKIDQVIDLILKEEVHFHFTKSSGHGGQNVNKRKTKAELYFNIWDSHLLTPEQKEKIIVNKQCHQYVHHHEQILIMTCQEERYQHANKKKVVHHFKQLFQEVLHENPERVATKVPKHILEKRKEVKKKHSQKKKLRRERMDNKE